MNSFAQNINYIAGLDNVYGSKVELYKNNLSLKNVEHDIELKFSYYNNDDKKIHSIIHSEPGVLVGGINDVLLSFKSLIDSAITGSEFTCTVSSGLQNFVVNNVVMISITIDSHNDIYKAYKLEAKVTTDGAVTYDVLGEVSDTLKILPSLAMITSSDINATTNVYEIKDEVITVSDSIASVTTVSDSIANVNITGTNITNVNIVGDDIANVNTVSTHISNVDTVSQSITDVNTVSDSIVDVGIVSTNIASINTVANAQNLADIIRVADDLNSMDINGIADITIVANDLVLGTDSNIMTVSESIANVNITGSSIDNVNTVGTNITDVGTVSTNIANVNITATDISSVNNVSSNIADVTTVSDGIANVNTVSDSIINVNTVATNITELNSISSNIVEILSADENAAIATAKALEASDSAASALVFKNAASVSADNSLISANNADASEANALNSASAAAVKANEALVSANAAITQAEIATVKAVEASESATNALISENGALSSKNSAAISASTATTKAAEAAASSSNASSSASIAGASASEASSSASAALLYKNSAYASATDAADSYNLATIKASDASASASIATTKADEAIISASSSAVSASVATTKANDASLSAASASASVNKAEKWATENEDIEVEVGEYSAKHWAMKAQGFAEGNAINIGYDNTSSGLVSTNVQAAIDEIVVSTAGINNATNITTGTLDDARLPDTISSSITGNAATATKWASSRTITLSGDVTGSVSIDGSANATITTTVAANSIALGTDTTGNYVAEVIQGTGISVAGTAGEGWSPTVSLTNIGTAGTYRSITTDAQGRVTSGTNPTTAAGYGLTDVYTKTEVQTVLPKVGFDTTNVTVPSAGQMAWNIDENTVDLGLNGATLQIGQEQLVRVRNNTVSTIVNGTAVMATGTLGANGRVTVAPANINGSSYKYMLGVVTESIAAGADGFCTVLGKVRGIQTNGANYGETWVDGDVIYVKDSDGGALTKVVPVGTQVKLPIAIVIHSHATNGTLFVRVTPIDENASYTKTEVNNGFVPLSADFILDLGGL